MQGVSPRYFFGTTLKVFEGQGDAEMGVRENAEMHGSGGSLALPSKLGASWVNEWREK